MAREGDRVAQSGYELGWTTGRAETLCAETERPWRHLLPLRMRRYEWVAVFGGDGRIWFG
jgi:hypothetical protein